MYSSFPTHRTFTLLSEVRVIPNKTRYSHRITMYVVTSVNTGTFIDVTYVAGANHQDTDLHALSYALNKDPVLILVHKLYST